MPRPRNALPSRHRAGTTRRGGGGGLLLPMIVLVSLVVLLGIGLWFAHQSSVPTNSLTLCRTDQPPPSATIVLVDVTDGLTESERVQVRAEVSRIRDAMPRFGLLEIHALGQQPVAAESPAISLCNPGRGADMNQIYQNPELAEQRWQKGFNARLDAALDEVVAGEVSGQSLIMEAIKTLSVERFGQPELDNTEKRLVLISDLLQHTPGTYSHYGQIQNYKSFAKTPFAMSVQTNLRGVSVHLDYIQRARSASVQGGTHVEFWIQHVEHNGGTVDRVKKIFGD